MNTQSILKGCIAASLISGMVFILLNILRLTFLANIVHPFLAFNLLVLGVISAVGLVQWRKLSIARIEWLLLASLVVTAVTTDYTDRTLPNILIDLLRPLVFIGSVVTLRSLLDVRRVLEAPLLKSLLLLTCWVTLFAVVICYVAKATNYPLIYPAFSTIDSILGLGWLMGAFSAPVAALYGLVLFVSGKRGVYLAALFLFLLLYRRSRRFACGIVAIAVLAGAVLVTSPSLRVDASAFLAKSSLSNIRYQAQKGNANLSAYFLNVISGGRVDEMRDATAHVSSPSRYWFGEGFGFTYHSQTFDYEEKAHRNLHFTPLSLIVYYGGVFFVLFGIYVGAKIPAAWRAFHDRSQPVLFSYAAYFLASLPFSLTEYNVFAYSNFAIACGLLAAATRQNNPVLPPVKPCK